MEIFFKFYFAIRIDITVFSRTTSSYSRLLMYGNIEYGSFKNKDFVDKRKNMKTRKTTFNEVNAEKFRDILGDG